MFRKFYPTVYVESAYTVDFQDLYNRGYRGLLTDVDNTLVGHGAPSDDRSEAFFVMMKNIGWKVCIISNNDEARVRPFAEANNCMYVCNAAKPKASGYIKGMKLLNLDAERTLFMGDQLFTDIFGANNAGIKSILVKPLCKDYKFLIILKRAGEVIVKFFYKSYASRHPGKL